MAADKAIEKVTAFFIKFFISGIDVGQAESLWTVDSKALDDHDESPRVVGVVPIIWQIDGHQGKYPAASHNCVMTEPSSVRCEMLNAIPQLRAIALALCRNADWADDLVQETLLRGCSNIESFRPGTNMNAWLATILRNQFYSDFRRRRYRAFEPLQAHADDLAVPPPQHQAIEMTELMDALSRLRLRERDAVVLVLLAGYSYQEAGEICGCPTGSIKSRVNRARKKLAELLSADEGMLVCDMDHSVISELVSVQAA